MESKLHVFAGTFASRADACKYTQQQWEPEPGDDVSDEEYAAWEVRNPRWPLREDLNTGLDLDFIETIDGDGRYDYLGRYLSNPHDLAAVRAAAGNANVLTLIFVAALHDPAANLFSTSKLKY